MSSNEFAEWFNNPEQRAAREEAMLMSGIPLEIKARRFLTKAGYRVIRWYYTTDLETGRELDFIADKMLSEHTLPNGYRIDFWIEILGECKRSATHDFFAFDADKPEGILGLSHFPVPFYVERDNPPFTFVIGSLTSPFHHYSFPFVADKIVEVDAANFKTRKGDNYGDEMTHEACETLLSASIHLKEHHQNLVDIVRRTLFASIRDDLTSISKKMSESTPSEVAKELLKKDLDSKLDKHLTFPIVFGVPLIVLDDNRGLVASTLRGDQSVEFERDVGMVLYPYVSENIQHFRRIGARGSFPVIMCKNASLSDALTIVESGTHKLIQQFTHFLTHEPEEFMERLLVTEVEQQRKTAVESKTYQARLL
jgi:hypothetical protein